VAAQFNYAHSRCPRKISGCSRAELGKINVVPGKDLPFPLFLFYSSAGMALGRIPALHTQVAIILCRELSAYNYVCHRRSCEVMPCTATIAEK
jgi:hypothetical protein